MVETFHQAQSGEKERLTMLVVIDFFLTHFVRVECSEEHGVNSKYVKEIKTL